MVHDLKYVITLYDSIKMGIIGIDSTRGGISFEIR